MTNQTFQTFNSRAPRRVVLREFDKPRPASVVNFRIREDGSLEKRCGIRFCMDLGAPIRGFWSGRLHGTYVTYFLAGDTVYSADLTNETYLAIGKVSSHGGDANFFCLQGQLYLTDGGKNVYLLEKDLLRTAIGYVPLLGKDWDPLTMGAIHEPLNLINRHARITYQVSGSAPFLVTLPAPIDSVESFLRNGTPVSEDAYRISEAYNALEIFDLKVGDRLEVAVTFSADEQTEELLSLFCSMKDSVFFSHGEQSRTYFFDGESSDMMFCTEYVPLTSLAESALLYPSDPLYLPLGHEFRVGDGTYPIRGAVRHRDSLLIFTEKDTWSATAESTGEKVLPTLPVNAELGCVASHGCVLSPNDPITISHHGLYRWESRDLEHAQRDAVRISAELDGILRPEDWRSASLFYNAMTEELWVNVRSRNEIWITSRKRGCWFCFTGLGADRLFDADGKVAMIRGSQVFVLEKDQPYDMDDRRFSYKIRASYESAPLDFDSSAPKNLSRLSAICDLDNSTLTVELCGDEASSVSCQLTDPKHQSYAVLERRLRSGRFRHARVRLLNEEYSRPVVHSLTLVAH